MLNHCFEMLFLHSSSHVMINFSKKSFILHNFLFHFESIWFLEEWFAEKSLIQRKKIFFFTLWAKCLKIPMNFGGMVFICKFFRSVKPWLCLFCSLVLNQKISRLQTEFCFQLHVDRSEERFNTLEALRGLLLPSQTVFTMSVFLLELLLKVLLWAFSLREGGGL